MENYPLYQGIKNFHIEYSSLFGEKEQRVVTPYKDTGGKDLFNTDISRIIFRLFERIHRTPKDTYTMLIGRK